MIDNKLPLSIGIPAYNEETNIKYLLNALISQKEENFVLKEIIVAVDGSSDNTAREAQSIADPRIKVINNLDRKGQASRQNEIVDMFTGNALLLLNADILPIDDKFIANFLKPLFAEDRVGIIGCRGDTLPARNFLEKIINFSVAMKQEMAEEWNQGNNLYMCHGHSRVFSKEFVKDFQWPQAYAEDSYSYLACLEHGFKFRYAPDTKVAFRSPQTFADHRRQSIRFAQGITQLYEYFPKKVVDQAHLIPISIFLRKTIKYFFKNPMIFSFYILLFAATFATAKFSRPFGVIWEPSHTSKSLIK